MAKTTAPGHETAEKKAPNRQLFFHIAEIALLLLAIPAVDYTGLLAIRLMDLQPHPFWLPILLATALYGRSVGLITVALATAVDGYFGWTGLVDHPDFYAYIVDNSRDPLLWLLAVSILGRIRERQIERLRDTELIKEQRTSEAQALGQRCQTLGREVAALEHRIASSGASAAGATLQTLDRLIEFPLEQTFDAFAQALNRLIGAQGVSVYLPEEGHWFPIFNSAAPVDGEFHERADRSLCQLCEKIVAAGRVVSCFRESDAKVLAGKAAMAASFRSMSGQFLGVVFIRDVDPACLTPAGEAALSLSSFILGSRAVQDTQLAIGPGQSARELANFVLKPKLRVVNGDQRGKLS